MKRCPQCEFIYEDDQSLCDMDGVLLVFDSRSLPKVHALATVSAPLPGKARRNRMVPAFATLLLMLAVGSVYYVSTTRNAAQIQYSPPSVTSTTAQPPVEAPTPDPNQAQLPTPESTPTEERQPAESHKTEPSPATKPAAAPTKQATTKPVPKKDDSKVESILKKTGKILKKPFKF